MAKFLRFFEHPFNRLTTVGARRMVMAAEVITARAVLKVMYLKTLKGEKSSCNL